MALKKGSSCEAALAALGDRIGGSFLLFCVGNFHGFGRDLAAFCGEKGE